METTIIANGIAKATGQEADWQGWAEENNATTVWVLRCGHMTNMPIRVAASSSAVRPASQPGREDFVVVMGSSA